VPLDPTDKLRAATASYVGDASFRAVWGGLSRTDVVARAAQQRAFVACMGSTHADLSGLDILDFGCGDGRWLRWYVELGADPARAVGVDVSDLRFAEAAAKNPLVRLAQIDGERLPFADASFDLVTQWVCFMCVPDEAWRVRIGAELLRVLRPGGHVFWWDTPRANPQLGDGAAMDPRRYFPGLACDARRICLAGRPSDAVAAPARPLFGPLVDLLAPRPSHVAARLGPKPG